MLVEAILFGLFCGAGYFSAATYFKWHVNRNNPIYGAWKKEAKFQERRKKELYREKKDLENDVSKLNQQLEEQCEETEKLMKRIRELHEYVRNFNRGNDNEAI